MSHTILLVDDDPAVREALHRVLLSENYAVVLACNGQEALDALTLNHVDLVLLDLNIPVVGGWAVLERMRANHWSPPAIVITAQPCQQGPALLAGATALMEKPLDLPLLLASMANLINGAQKHVFC